MKWISALFLLALTLSGCSRDPIAGRDRSIYLVGDSLMASASWENGSWDDQVPDGYVQRTEAFGGKTAADHLEQVEEYGNDDVPERLVIELGTNEARAGGWEPADADSYRTLVAAAPPRTCIVVVLPGAAPSASAFDRDALGAAATSISQIAEERPRRQVADFADFIASHPELMQADGIHLVDGDEAGHASDAARVAYRDWLWQFVTRCEGERRRDEGS